MAGPVARVFAMIQIKYLKGLGIYHGTLCNRVLLAGSHYRLGRAERGLGSRIGSLRRRARVLFLLVAFTVSLVGWRAGRAEQGFAQIPRPKHLLLGAFFCGFHNCRSPLIAPHFGVGNAVFFVFGGAAVSARLRLTIRACRRGRVSPWGGRRAPAVSLSDCCAGVWLTPAGP